MISNEIVINYKVVYLIEIYNFGFGRFSIQGHLYNSKKLNFKICALETEFWDHKWFQMKKVIIYKVVDCVEIYNFDIKFVFI